MLSRWQLQTKDRRGFMLVLVIICLLVLFGVAMLAMTMTVRELRSAGTHQAKSKTFYAAEGALNQALHGVKQGYLDKEDPRFVAFDPLDPQAIFKRYVDDPRIGLRRYLAKESGGGGETLVEGREQRGIGTVDYKVLLNDVASLTAKAVDDETSKDLPESFYTTQQRQGRSVQVKSQAVTRQGVTTKLQRRIILSYLPNIIFKYGMLTNRLKECQFCHMYVVGDIGQVGGEHFSPISPHVTMGLVRGDIYLSGDFRLDQHPAHKQMLELDGEVVERVNDNDLLPNSWPSILSRHNPKSPEIAGFYVELVDRAALQGLSTLSGGEILVSDGLETDRFKRVTELRNVVKQHVILEGTRDNPIQLNGPLVIRGDLMIRGWVTGHGSIYVERNIYLIGDIRYVHGPQDNEWSNVFAAEMRQRQSIFAKRDFTFDKLGLFAGGNVILGNLASDDVYRYIEYFLNYESSGMLQDPQNKIAGTERFEKFSVYDPLGLYAMDGSSGIRNTTIKTFRYFDRYEDGSDYNKNGKRSWGEGMKWIQKDNVSITSTGILPAGAKADLTRHDWHDGWISKQEFADRATQGATSANEKTNQVRVIDGTIYTDGAFTGYKPSNDKGKSEIAEYNQGRDLDGDGLTFNGAVIARDIDVLAPGGWYVRYDNRNYVGQGAAIDFEPSRVVEVTGWQEK